MGVFDFLRNPDINQGIREWAASNYGVLIDVRTAGEYHHGHIPGSRNIPLDEIHSIDAEEIRKDTPLFVHCLSGGRSSRAVSILRQLGYTNVTNIGGIQGYRGKVEV